jgi:hypothetical protein
MATTSPVLLLEFNELSPRLMDQFMSAGQLPNFNILHDESEIYVTEAVEKYPYLEPWIQWITVHCGLNYDCDTLWELPDDTMLTVADSDRRVPFFGMFYRIAGLKSGMHHPHGMLWVRHPDKRHRIHEDRVPLTVIAPTILKMLGVLPPEFMRGAA